VLEVIEGSVSTVESFRRLCLNGTRQFLVQDSLVQD